MWLKPTFLSANATAREYLFAFKI